MMECLIKKAGVSELPELYEKFIVPNFPECEVKPLKSIVRMMQTGLYSVIYAQEGAKKLGVAFLTTYPNGNIYLLDYLAVDTSCRSKGIGSRLLSACAEFTGAVPVLIETEAIGTAKDEAELRLRERRNRFYSENGAKLSGVNTRIFGMTYDNWTLSKGEGLDAEAVGQGLENIYKFMVNDEKMYDANVEIPYTIK